MNHFDTYSQVENSGEGYFVEFFSVLLLGGIAASELYLFGKSLYNNFAKCKHNRLEESDFTIVRPCYDMFADLISDNRQIIIVRSVPGAGRRQLISELVEYANDEDYAVCDINDYFTNNGKYEFKGKDIGKAEDYCLTEFIKAVKNETNLIFVSGHFYETWMYDKYIQIAELAGYEHRVVAMECRDKNELKRFNKRSTHNVPYSRSLKIYQNWETDNTEVECPTFNDESESETENCNEKINQECLIVTSDEE